MQIIWRLDRCFLGEIIASIDEPRPAYTTVSTVVRVLETKGFVAHHICGNAHQYYPVVAKADYSGWLTGGIVQRFFDGSPAQMLSAFAGNGTLTASQYDELKQVAAELLKSSPQNK